jgi:hypothetical protein
LVVEIVGDGEEKFIWRSGSVTSANEDSDTITSPFEVFSLRDSKVSAILVTFGFTAEGRPARGTMSIEVRGYV